MPSQLAATTEMTPIPIVAAPSPAMAYSTTGRVPRDSWAPIRSPVSASMTPACCHSAIFLPRLIPPGPKAYGDRPKHQSGLRLLDPFGQRLRTGDDASNIGIFAGGGGGTIL